jgi:hypothetical protein
MPVYPGGHRYDGDDIWPRVGSSSSDGKGSGGAAGNQKVVDGAGIVELYASLRQGQSVKQWYALHSQELANIDVRRFITFGIIKGFLYRVHKYAYATGLPAPSSGPATSASSVKGGATSSTISGGADAPSSRPNSVHLGGATGSGAGGGGDDHSEDQGVMTSTSFRSSAARSTSAAATSYDDEDDEESIANATLSKYLDGTHSFDQICTELEISERELTARLKKYPCEVQIIHR